MAGKAADKRIVSLKIVHTSDVHGSFFMHDYVNNHPVKGSLSRVYAYVQSLRRIYGERLLLLDGGDILQGTPVVYCSNFVVPTGKNLAAEIMNYMAYDTGVMGNHDLETGHEVYDRWTKACRFPILGANIIRKSTGRCYLPPYCVLVRGGVKVAVLGMTTPAVPNWLPSALWSGLEFEDMVSCARRWVPVILENDKPDVLVGLFHSGKEGGIVTSGYAENAALDVAREVAGFDVVCYGHDHIRNCETVKGPDGRNVLCCAPSSMAVSVGEIDLQVEMGEDGTKAVKADGRVKDLSFYQSESAKYMQRYFNRYIHNTEYYVGQKIGRFAHTIESQDAYFGPSAFVDLVHQVQLETTGAQISFAAPVSFAAKIRQGDVCVRDVFNLYRYDDVLYTMRLTGQEVKGILEMSYGLWTNRMETPEDHVMLLDYVLDEGKRLGFKHLAYNFDSAAGIRYTVDVTKPYGEKIEVEGMADGSAFHPEAWYTVVVNSYRGNGGGELFTKGAGIPHGQLNSRLVASTDKDLRSCIIQYLKEHGEIDARPLWQWKFVPEEWAVPACRRDRALLFGRGAKETDAPAPK